MATLKELIKQAKPGLKDLAKKLNIKLPPANLGEVRGHERAKLAKSTSGQFVFYMECADKLPLLLVSNAPTAKVDARSDGMAKADKTKGHAYGTYKLDVTAKSARFTLDKASMSDPNSKKLVVDRALLAEAIWFLTEWDPQGQNVKVFWAVSAQPLPEDPVFKDWDGFKKLAPEVQSEFGLYGAANQQADSAFWALVCQYQRAGANEKPKMAKALFDIFCGGDTSSQLEVNAGVAIAPKNQKLVTAIAAIEKGTAKPTGAEFDDVTKATSSTVPEVGLWFWPKVALAEQICCQDALHVRLADTIYMKERAYAEKTWEPIRKKLEGVGFKVQSWKY